MTERNLDKEELDKVAGGGDMQPINPDPNENICHPIDPGGGGSRPKAEVPTGGEDPGHLEEG
jgi:hypothetical protein